VSLFSALATYTHEISLSTMMRICFC